MISQNQNSFENLGTILLDLLTRRGKTITEELRDALAFFMLHLGQAEHLGGLCAELDATPQNKKYAELLREAELLTDSSNKIADEPNNLSVAPTPFLLDESEPKKLRIYSRRNFCSESRLAAGIHGMCSTSASDVNEVRGLSTAGTDVKECTRKRRQESLLFKSSAAGSRRTCSFGEILRYLRRSRYRQNNHRCEIH